MLIVHSPPSSQQLFIDPCCPLRLSTDDPRLVISDVMDHVDGALEVPVGRDILVISAGCAVIGKAQTMPFSKMHIQQPLVSTVETDTSLS